ncbi:MAG: lytic transglycosylase domain-containing protein [bacterium]|nr:lytic transglycosylase domain-containing protein [bacterium]
MDSLNRIGAIQNRVGDIIQKVSTKMSRFEAGPTRPPIAGANGRAAALLNGPGQTAGAGTAAAGTAASQAEAEMVRNAANAAGVSGAAPLNPAGLQGDRARPGAATGFAAELEAMIQQEASSQSVSPDLIRAVVQAESAGRPDARSKVGAVGLMQLMPGTARELGVDPTNPRENIRGGVKYLNQMAGKFGDLDLALAAYNAGPGAVKKYGGVPPYRETIDYISKIRKSLGEPTR